MKRFEHIVIASDLDGTLLALNEEGDARNRERIRYFIENGGRFTIASGRIPHQIEGRIPYPPELCNLPAVTGNGTCLYDFASSRVLEEQRMPYQTVCKIFEYLEHYFPDVAGRASTPEGLFAVDDSNPYIRSDRERMGEIVSFRPLSEWEAVGVYKIALRGDADRIAALWEMMKRDFADDLEMAPSGITLLDVQPKGSTKASLLRDMVNRYVPHPVVLCTVGDFYNDVDMHRVADLPVCPANAVDAVKEVCALHLCRCREGVIGDLVDYLDTHDVSHLVKQRGAVYG